MIAHQRLRALNLQCTSRGLKERKCNEFFHAFDPITNQDIRPQVSALLKEIAGWDVDKRKEEIKKYKETKVKSSCSEEDEDATSSVMESNCSLDQILLHKCAETICNQYLGNGVSDVFNIVMIGAKCVESAFKLMRDLRTSYQSLVCQHSFSLAFPIYIYVLNFYIFVCRLLKKVLG